MKAVAQLSTVRALLAIFGFGKRFARSRAIHAVRSEDVYRNNFRNKSFSNTCLDEEKWGNAQQN